MANPKGLGVRRCWQAERETLFRSDIARGIESRAQSILAMKRGIADEVADCVGLDLVCLDELARDAKLVPALREMSVVEFEVADTRYEGCWDIRLDAGLYEGVVAIDVKIKYARRRDEGHLEGFARDDARSHLGNSSLGEYPSIVAEIAAYLYF